MLATWVPFQPRAWATLAAAGVYLLTLATTRIGSLGSLLGASVFAIVQTMLMVSEGDWSEQWSLSAFTLAVPIMIVYRHRSNIGRILRGEELRVGERRKQDPVEVNSDSDDEVTPVPDEP